MAYQLADANAAPGTWGLKPHIRMKINHPENELKDKKTSRMRQLQQKMGFNLC